MCVTTDTRFAPWQMGTGLPGNQRPQLHNLLFNSRSRELLRSLEIDCIGKQRVAKQQHRIVFRMGCCSLLHWQSTTHRHFLHNLLSACLRLEVKCTTLWFLAQLSRIIFSRTGKTELISHLLSLPLSITFCLPFYTGSHHPQLKGFHKNLQALIAMSTSLIFYLCQSWKMPVTYIVKAYIYHLKG